MNKYCKNHQFISPNTGCHPGSTTLELESAQHIPISGVKVGDIVRTPSGYEPVVLKMHATSGVTSDYVVLAAGEFSLALSGDHHVIVNGTQIPAGSVSPGDVVSTTAGEVQVNTVTQVTKNGVFHIMVPSGTYFADGVASSDFVDAHLPRTTWDIWRAYAALRYWLGVPMSSYVIDCYQDGICKLPINWFADAIEYTTGVDPWTIDGLPAHTSLVLALLTELADVAVRLVLPCSGALFASLTAVSGLRFISGRKMRI